MAEIEAFIASAPPKWWILHYAECVPDVMSRIKEKGPAFEQAHRANAQPHLDSGKLLAAGALGDPVEGGLWIFQDVTKEEIEAAVASDPYVQEGLITGWTIKPYHVVLGSLPDTPARNKQVSDATTEHPAGPGEALKA